MCQGFVYKDIISLNEHTLDKEHLKDWCADVQEDGLASSDYSKHPLLRRGETTPCIGRRPHINVEEGSIILRERGETFQVDKSIEIIIIILVIIIYAMFTIRAIPLFPS